MAKKQQASANKVLIVCEMTQDSLFFRRFFLGLGYDIFIISNVWRAILTIRSCEGLRLVIYCENLSSTALTSADIVNAVQKRNCVSCWRKFLVLATLASAPTPIKLLPIAGDADETRDLSVRGCLRRPVTEEKLRTSLLEIGFP